MDTYFLRQEKAFRDMFKAIAAHELGAFRMDPTPFARKIGWWKTTWTITLSVFYGSLVLISLLIGLMLSLTTSQTAAAPGEAGCACMGARAPLFVSR